MNINHAKAAPVDLGVSAPSGDRRDPTTTEQKGSTSMSDNRYPVDPTGPLTVGSIPKEDLSRLIAATVPVEPVPAHPLDAYSTAEIVAEIARRPGGAEALRELAEAEPAFAVLLDGIGGSNADG